MPQDDAVTFGPMVVARLFGPLEWKLGDSVVFLDALTTALALVLAVAGPTPRQTLERLLDGAPEDLDLGALEAHTQQGEVWSLDCRSDLDDYRASAHDLRELGRSRAELAAGFVPHTQALQSWLQEQRLDVRLLFLKTLVATASKLEQSGHTDEAAQNLGLAQRALHEKTTPGFAARLRVLLGAHAWAGGRVAEATNLLAQALPNLPVAHQAECRVNLGAALLRLGRLHEAQETLNPAHFAQAAPTHQGWAALHRANTERFWGNVQACIAATETAYAHAKTDQDGHLAMNALALKGEALLLEATTTSGQHDPKAAVVAFGQALGIGEVLGEDANAGVLAGLADAHAAWGNKQKALGLAERAFKSARASKDSSATVRALLALHRITGIGSFAENALREAQQHQHQPFEVVAMLACAKKRNDQAQAQVALEMAKNAGMAGLVTDINAWLEQFGSVGGSASRVTI